MTHERIKPPKNFIFVRCSFPECFAILTKVNKIKGSCDCGLNKFRGIPLGKGKITDLEEKLFLEGLVHIIDIAREGLSPAVLNLDNPAFWEEVKKNFGRQVMRARKREAEKRRGELEDWLAKERDIEGINIVEIAAEIEAESLSGDSSL